MHGHKQHGELKYVCSRYEDSDGKECEHNTGSSERLFKFACRLVTHGLGFAAREAALREKLHEHALRLRSATPDSLLKEQADYWEAKIATLTADSDAAGRHMAVERDVAVYEMLKREYSRLGGELPKPKAEFAKATADPNARKESRKSLNRRLAVDTTRTAPSGKPGRKTAGSLTKDKSFGHESSGGRT